VSDNRAAWVITLGAGIVFLIAAIATSGALRLGWLVLGLASLPIAYIRFKAARKT
jgi:Flp pilus assembly protein TadB